MPRKIGRIDIIAVGKMQSAAWRSALAEYEGRLRRYTRLEVTEVKDAVGRGLPDAAAMQKEGEALLQAAAGAGRIITLTPEGKHITSPNLARFLRREIELYGRVAFLIGGPLGVTQDILDASHTRLSLSYLTFTHEMARVILVEQLYRAFTIMNNENYHK